LEALFEKNLQKCFFSPKREDVKALSGRKLQQDDFVSQKFIMGKFNGDYGLFATCDDIITSYFVDIIVQYFTNGQASVSLPLSLLY